MVRSRGSALPGPLQRAWRSPTRLAAIALVAAVSIGAATLRTEADVRLVDTVDSHWRGLYDILVRPGNQRLGLETTGGLIEPDFIGFTGSGGITRAQLDAIRSIPRVEIAAPVAFIGLQRTAPQAPGLYTSVIPARATLFRVELSVVVSDGLSDRAVSTSAFRVLLGGENGTGTPTAISDLPGQDIAVLAMPDGTTVVSFSTHALLPGLSSPIIAVDPVAERRLIGGFGEFLDVLADVTTETGATASTFDTSKILPGFDAGVTIGSLAGGTAAMRARPVFPVVVSSRMYVPLSAIVRIEQVGGPIDTVPNGPTPRDVLDEVEAAAGPRHGRVESARVDLGASLRPLRANDLSIAWPGTPASSGGTLGRNLAEFDPRVTSRPRYVLRAGLTRTPSFEIVPAGLVDRGGDPISSGSSAQGSEQAYREWEVVESPLTEGFVSQAIFDRPFIFAPVGEFTLDNLAFPRDPLSYAPLGTYDPPNTVLVAGPSGAATSPIPMSPTLNPAGLLAVPPLGIADISAAESLRGLEAIDAIRVRVSGIEDFGPDSIAVVERVASEIATLGLDVDIVAGSSPQSVSIFVPGYDTSTSPAGALGWVTQQWTTVGAAIQVTQGIGSVQAWLMLLALLGAAVLVFGVAYIDLDARRRERLILAANGWGSLDIARWFVSESAVGTVVVLGAGLVAWWLNRDPVGLVIPVAVACLFPGASILTLAATAGIDRLTGRGRGRPREPGRLDRLPTVRSPSTLGVRTALRRPARSVVLAIAIAVAATSVVDSVVLLLSEPLRAGPTMLANTTIGIVGLLHFAMLGLTALAAISLVAVALRRDAADRGPEFRLLEAAGWSAEHVSRQLRWERVVVCAPASVIAVALTLASEGPMSAGVFSPTFPTVIAGVLALSPVAWGGLAARRGAN